MKRTTRSIPANWTRILKLQRARRQHVHRCERELDTALRRRDAARHRGGPGWPTKVGAANLALMRARHALIDAVSSLYLGVES